MACSCVFTEQRDDLMQRLNHVMKDKERFMAIKERNIDNIKQILVLRDFTPAEQYEINKKLFDEYRKYCADSAIAYMLKNSEIALQLNDSDRIAETAIQLSRLYSTTGLYIEASELLSGIDRQQLHESLLLDYFDAYSVFYSHYGQSNGYETYYLQSGLYRDSLLMYSDVHSFRYRLEYAAGKIFTNDHSGMEELLSELLDEAGDSPDKGYIAWLAGYMHRYAGNSELSKKYFIISAISDIEHCLRDHASFQSLALVFFEEGKIALANQFIHYAVEDALLCNVRHRISEASNYYPFISDIYQRQTKKQMTHLYVSLIVIGFLLIVLTISLSFSFHQNRKLSRISTELSQTNRKLSELNQQLTVTNNNLQESNLVKEEYIAHFFDICSTYVDKLESYLRIMNKHAKQKRIDEMLKVLNYDIVRQELNELYRKFDTIFLNLYPTFVEDFNAIRDESYKITLKHGELMNTELRIFALIRLGITDSVKIASFLRYSLSAIYNYRVKARKYCHVDKKAFEELVMKMGLGTEDI